eukprot:jgi/Ulvmu1/12916/UM099_0010.1
MERNLEFLGVLEPAGSRGRRHTPHARWQRQHRSAPHEKSKFLGSGGSMVARLKLKGIDGRAPPGVEPAA